MFFTKSQEIEKLMRLYTDAVLEGYDYYLVAMTSLLGDATRDESHMYMVEMAKLERKADAIRHHIIRQMLVGGLVVDSRKSLMRMIEHIDHAVDVCEDVIQEIYLQNMNILESLKEPIEKINAITKEQLDLLVHAVLGIVGKYDLNEMFEVIRKIELLESEVDTLEHSSVIEVFEMPLELAYQMQMRMLISQVGNIADIIEDVSDEIEIIMMARKV
ncbi:MAG: DUF47 family protein [Vallitaleaceae bacterium]|nr:DUF47 family protein [Vallitaleaceae bacterium]